jgi:ethanolamine utilization protein EutQ (cupin superfamily)
VNKKPFSKKGDFLFIPAGESIEFSSKEEKEYSFAVLELK